MHQNSTLLSACILMLAASALPGVKAQAANDNTAYGILAFSDEQSSLTNNVVTFDIVSDAEPVFQRAVAFYDTSTAGAYGDGYYYIATSQPSGSAEVPKTLVRVSLADGVTETVGNLTGYTNLINDMTYDWSTSTMYAISRVDETYSALYTISLTDARSTRIATLDRKFFTLAASYSGELYAISFAGDFCRINKTTGEVTVIGSTGQHPQKFQSMEFDHATRTLWWIASTRVMNEGGTIEVPESFVATINPATGAVTRHQEFGDNQLAGLYIPSFAAADNCPAPVIGATVTAAAGGEAQASLSWINPTKTFGGDVLKAITRVEIIRDGKTVGSVTSAQPGARSAYTDVIGGDKGSNHTWRIIVHNGNGPGAAVEVSAFVGRDVPAAVSAVNVEKLGPNAARVYWDAVTTGVNGGWTDAAGMLYDVVRNPGGTTVARDLTATEWMEPGVETSGTWTYSVTAHNGIGTSAATVSDPVILGPKLGVPYVCDFDNLGQWTAVDRNENADGQPVGDGNTWVYYNLAWAKAAGAYIMTSNNAADDWLVSNEMELEPATTYKVTLRYLSQGTHPLKVCLLKDGDVTAPLQEITTLDLGKVNKTETKEFTFTTGENIGDCNFAFHDGAAKGNLYFLIDRLEIEKVVDRNLVASSIRGNAKPIEGNPYGYTVTVGNRGTKDYDSFTVELLDGEGKVVASQAVAETLEAGASKDYIVEYTFPIGSKLTSLRGHVSAAGDEVEADDTTAPLELTVMPLGTPEELEIGSKTLTSYRAPMNLYSKFGATLNIYSASEIPIKKGRITGLKLDYKGSYSPLNNVELKVYMANTDREKAPDGWIPVEDMTLVYEGTHNLVSSANDVLDLALSQAFEYDGRNLALYVKTSLENSNSAYAFIYQPYYTSPVSGNKAIYYGADSDFEVPDAPNSSSGNSYIRLMVQSAGASISGKVKDAANQPVAGAEVSIQEIHAVTRSAEDGSYTFNFVPNDTYTLTASMFGYKQNSEVKVTVADENMTADIILDKLPTYSVSGRVLAPDGSAVENADVALKGYADLAMKTDASGRFLFESVVTAPGTTVTVTKPWHLDKVQTTDLDENWNLGDLTLEFAHFKPANVSVQTTDETSEIAWEIPSAQSGLGYDSGNADTQVGIQSQAGTVIIGTVFRTPMTLKGASWYTTFEGGPHNSVNIYIFDLDEEGNPSGTLLYSQRAVLNSDNQWNSIEIPDGVEAPRGCFVSVNYPGFHGIGVDHSPKTHPFKENVYAFSTDYNSGDYMYLTEESLGGNLMIRCTGDLYSDEGIRNSDEEFPAYARYNVWRSAGFGNEDWQPVNSEPVAGLTAADPTWAQAPAGVYRYAVSTVYPDGSESAKVVLPYYVARQMTGKLTLKIRTNSHSGDAKGAVVSIAGQDPFDSRNATVGEGGIVEFNDIWRCPYTVEVSLPGYEFDARTADLYADKDLKLEDLVLREIIAVPVNLSVSGDAEKGFRLTWNESGEIFDDFEDHDAFAVASAGEVGWLYRDADGSRTFAEQEFDFPGRTQPCSFMVFNPWLTTPSMADARSASLPYSGKQELACFAGRSGSDDWFISPRLTYHNDYTFSFHARGYSQTYGEVIRVGYSMTDTDPESFTWLAENVDVPKQTWTEFKYTVPAGARYVAVNCVSPDGFTLFMDDVTISGGNDMAMNTAVSGPEVKYEVSLDGEKLADTEDCSYMLTPGSGEHYAEVRAVYASGESAPAKIVFGESGVNGVQTDKISVRPNPAPGYTNVRGEFNRAVLYDLSGRALRAFDGSDSRLDLGGVQSGIYLLVIEPLSGKPQTVKLTVK